jgi:gas vesicle protein
MANNDSRGSFIMGFLVGGIVGAAVGLLMAPKSGAETRAELAEQSDVWRTRAEEMAARVREGVGPTMDTMRERVGPAVDTMRDRMAPAVEGVRERVAPVTDRIAALRGQGAGEPETDGSPPMAAEASGSADDDAGGTEPKSKA